MLITVTSIVVLMLIASTKKVYRVSRSCVALPLMDEEDKLVSLSLFELLLHHQCDPFLPNPNTTSYTGCCNTTNIYMWIGIYPGMVCTIISHLFFFAFYTCIADCTDIPLVDCIIKWSKQTTKDK